MVSLPPTPTGRALAGDAGRVRLFSIDCQRNTATLFSMGELVPIIALRPFQRRLRMPNLRHLGGPKDVQRFGDLFVGLLKHFRREVSSGAYSPQPLNDAEFQPFLSRVGHGPIPHCYPILNQDDFEIQVGPEGYGPYPSTRRPYCLRTISNENLASMTGPCSSRTAIAI